MNVEEVDKQSEKHGGATENLCIHSTATDVIDMPTDYLGWVLPTLVSGGQSQPPLSLPLPPLQHFTTIYNRVKCWKSYIKSQ